MNYGYGDDVNDVNDGASFSRPAEGWADFLVGYIG